MTRYALMSIGLDVLEARQLAERGGCGPIGADGKVMTYDPEGERWRSGSSQ